MVDTSKLLTTGRLQTISHESGPVHDLIYLQHPVPVLPFNLLVGVYFLAAIARGCLLDQQIESASLHSE